MLVLAGLEVRGGGVDTSVDDGVLAAVQVGDGKGGDRVLFGAEVELAGRGEIGGGGGIEDGLACQP